MNKKEITVYIELWVVIAILIILVLVFVVHSTSAAPTDPVPPGEEYPDTNGWDWRVEWVNGSETAFHLLYIGDYPNQTSGWPGCHVVIEATCRDEHLDAPDIGTLCKRIGSRVLTCQGDTQDLKWERNVKKWCNYYFPLAIASPPYEPACTCEGYSVKVYKQPEYLFTFPLPAYPGMGYGPDLQVYEGNTVTHEITWTGSGGFGADPCLVSADLTVKAVGHPQSVIDCISGWCEYDCSDMYYTQTASVIQNNVYLSDGSICRGRYNGYDPCDPLTGICIDAPVMP